VIEALERCRRLRSVEAPGNPFRLGCSLEAPADPADVEDAWPGRRLPDSLLEMWATCRSARLFEDLEYGQWGLRLLTPAGSAARTDRETRDRPDDMRPDDIVVGEFIGDSDLLLVTTTAVVVAGPIDGRDEWPAVATDLGAFFTSYVAELGAKYWEKRQS
jgi:hypothetical protein